MSPVTEVARQDGRSTLGLYRRRKPHRRPLLEPRPSSDSQACELDTFKCSTCEEAKLLNTRVVRECRQLSCSSIALLVLYRGFGAPITASAAQPEADPPSRPACWSFTQGCTFDQQGCHGRTTIPSLTARLDLTSRHLQARSIRRRRRVQS